MTRGVLRRGSAMAWRGRAARVAAAGLTLAVFGAIGVSSAQASAPAYTIMPFAGTGTQGPAVPGPATASDFNNPTAVAVDASGNVYVADGSNYEVEKITPSGTLSIIAGNGTSGNPTPGAATSSPFTDPDGVAVDASGNVYISDQTSGEVVKVTPSGTLSIIAGTGTQGQPTPGPATSSRLETPTGLAVDSAGDIYVADDNAAEVLKITPQGTMSIVAGTGSGGTPAPGLATSSPLEDPDAVALDTEGNLYIADAGSYVEKVNPSGVLSIFAGNGSYGNPVAGPATSSPLSEPSGISVDLAGNIDVADYNDIEQISPGGTLSIIAGNNTGAAPTYGQPSTSSPVYYPDGVAVSTSGIVYIADVFTIDRLVPAAPANATPPSISGTVAVGQTLTASNGSWSNDPTGYSYQWQDCDSSGANCTDFSGATSGTYTVAGGDVGHTIRVVVTAENGGGSTADNSAATVAVPSAAPPTPGGPVAVSVGAVPPAGITVNDHGEVMLTLVCPISPSGCDASGVLTIHLPNPLEAHTTNVAGAGTVLASFSGKQIASGHNALTAVRLRTTVLRQLQTLGIRRVKVTLSISNHLSGAPAVNSTQTVYLLIPVLARGACSSPTGQLGTTTLGQVTLGRTRARQLLPRTGVYNYYTDNYCLYKGAGIRVGYASTRLLGSAHSATEMKGDAVFALTANPFYSLDGVRPGSSLAAAAGQLKLSKVIHAGLNDWYVIAGSHSNEILKVRHNVILGIGIVNRQLTRTRSAQRQLLRNF
jgi:hypothetical protein